VGQETGRRHAVKDELISKAKDDVFIKDELVLKDKD